ncbi:hypothetical protein DRB96_32945 [Streptomyces sp. ICC1]|nr:hypothetical protein DRB89_32175 [Streptomyces sp. ICC4]AWZ16250.1 hypothetical protein DRB96_32945 [Streptomyces sp. ICC1]
MAPGRTTHAVMPPAMAVPMVTTSFAIVSELCAAPVGDSNVVPITATHTARACVESGSSGR